jgi:hypothetical protein
MKTKHTPGPWKVGGGRYLPITAKVKGKSAQIGRAESFGQISDEECEANGRLIAAAPELLHQLKDLVRCIREFQLGDYSPLMDEIFDSEAAIKDAEGG